MNESLLRNNALACEEAKRPICHCRCQGALHGKPHSEDWMREQLAAMPAEKEQAERNATAIYKRLLNGR